MATKSAKNKSGGSQDTKAQTLKKAATSGKGKQHQPKGSAKQSAESHSATKQKNPSSSPMCEMEF